MGWTQPLCVACWNRDNPDRQAGNDPVGPPERCCKCGDPTRSGIYVRIDPATVPYPQPDE
jgi:hypothetical protein